jgi:hypothetical protein
MIPADLIREACSKPLTTGDGDDDPIHLEAPLSEAEIDSFEATLPCPLPAEIRDLLRYCRGFYGGGGLDSVDFTGGCPFEAKHVFPYGLPIAADGCGNFWVVDVLPDSNVWGPIYYACHDPPVIVYQSSSLENFLTEYFKMGTPPHRSLISDVSEEHSFHIWSKNPDVRSREECAADSDPEISSFAQQLEPSFQIVDLRNAKVGSGFSWGRYGPNTAIRRHSTAPIFAYARPRNLVNKFLGR